MRKCTSCAPEHFEWQSDSDEDDEFKGQDMVLKKSMPFAIVGGTHALEVNGKRVRGRQYPWGFVEVDNPAHSDFALLRRFLIQTHMQDLKDVTHDVHYENYRVQCLSDLARLENRGIANGGNPAPRSSSNASGQLARIAASKSGTAKSVEDLTTEDTEKLLAEKDEEILRMQDMIRQMQSKMEMGSV